MKFFLILLTFLSSFAYSQSISDAWDPFDNSYLTDTTQDAGKTSEQLISEAVMLLESNPLTARSKLLLALRKNPESELALLMLGTYYDRHVQHYRLAIKYIKKAQEVFEKKYGKPPYFSSKEKYLHSDILRQLSLIRQNLDNYEGALATIKEYEIYGYNDPYLIASKAWILFKLKRYAEAIKICEDEIKKGGNSANIMNVLGILYSVVGQREKAIKTLNSSYQYEKSLGTLGQAATPLNNMGEVYREIFQEPEAAAAWEKALYLPDGCEHILPSFNLSVVQIDAFRLDAAEQAMNDFESCIAQYPLRNGEEYQALINLMRGRIALYRGEIDSAIKHYNIAIEKQQWFGKIGTHIEDLEAALYSELMRAYKFKNNHLLLEEKKGIAAYLKFLKDYLINKVKAKWYARKAKLILTEKLDNFEDAYVRHSDSIIDYPSLGEVFAELPKSTVNRFLAKLAAKDGRKGAQLYYTAWQAENLLARGSKKKAVSLLKKIIADKRSDYDLTLKGIAYVKLAKALGRQDPLYSRLIKKASEVSPAFLSNYGVKQ